MLYRKPGSRFWWYRFSFKKRRVQRSTKLENRRAAETVAKAAWLGFCHADVGLKAPMPTVLVGELLDRLVRNYEMKNRKSSQNISLIATVRKDFGSKRSDETTTEHLASYVERKLREGLAPATINRRMETLRRCYTLAKLTPPDVAKLPEDNARQGFVVREQIDKVIEFLPEDLRDFVLFGFLTGMRSKEIKSLAWKDVADNTVIRLQGVNAKTKKPRSIVAVGELGELLERRQQAKKVKTASGTSIASHVFHRGGVPVGEFRRSWKTACIAAGLGQMICSKCGQPCPKKRCCKAPRRYVGNIFHDLRRSAVRTMVRAHVPTSVAMAISGHRTDSVFRRYDIVSTDDLESAMLAVDHYHKSQERKVATL